MQVPDLKTPFGNLEVHLWKNDGFAVVIHGKATVNGVLYSTRLDVPLIGETWKEKHLTFDRADRKDNADNAAYPFKAREKFSTAVLALWLKAIGDNPAWLAQAAEERLLKDIVSLTNEIATLTQTLEEKRQALQALQKGQS